MATGGGSGWRSSGSRSPPPQPPSRPIKPRRPFSPMHAGEIKPPSSSPPPPSSLSPKRPHVHTTGRLQGEASSCGHHSRSVTGSHLVGSAPPSHSLHAASMNSTAPLPRRVPGSDAMGPQCNISAAMIRGDSQDSQMSIGSKHSESSAPSLSISQHSPASAVSQLHGRPAERQGGFEVSTQAASEPSTRRSQSPPRRRTRMLMTRMQWTALNGLLERTVFPSTREREELAQEIGLTPRQVQVWFQNQRQKRRREQTDLGYNHQGRQENSRTAEASLWSQGGPSPASVWSMHSAPFPLQSGRPAPGSQNDYLGGRTQTSPSDPQSGTRVPPSSRYPSSLQNNTRRPERPEHGSHFAFDPPPAIRGQHQGTGPERQRSSSMHTDMGPYTPASASNSSATQRPSLQRASTMFHPPPDAHGEGATGQSGPGVLVRAETHPSHQMRSLIDARGVDFSVPPGSRYAGPASTWPEYRSPESGSDPGSHSIESGHRRAVWRAESDRLMTRENPHALPDMGPTPRNEGQTTPSGQTNMLLSPPSRGSQLPPSLFNLVLDAPIQQAGDRQSTVLTPPQQTVPLDQLSIRDRDRKNALLAVSESPPPLHIASPRTLSQSLPSSSKPSSAGAPQDMDIDEPAPQPSPPTALKVKNLLN